MAFEGAHALSSAEGDTNRMWGYFNARASIIDDANMTGRRRGQPTRPFTFDAQSEVLEFAATVYICTLVLS